MAKLHLSWKRKINKQMTWGLMSKEFWPHPSAFPRHREAARESVHQEKWAGDRGKARPDHGLPGRMQSQKPLQRWDFLPCWSPWNWSPDHNNSWKHRDTVSETCFIQAKWAWVILPHSHIHPNLHFANTMKISNKQKEQRVVQQTPKWPCL